MEVSKRPWILHRLLLPLVTSKRLSNPATCFSNPQKPLVFTPLEIPAKTSARKCNAVFLRNRIKSKFLQPCIQLQMRSVGPLELNSCKAKSRAAPQYIRTPGFEHSQCACVHACAHTCVSLHQHNLFVPHLVVVQGWVECIALACEWQRCFVALDVADQRYDFASSAGGAARAGLKGGPSRLV